MAARLDTLLQRPLPTTPESPTRQRQRRLNQTQASLVIEGYLSGKTMDDLAVQWQISRWTVAAHLKRAGVEARLKRVSGLRDEQEVIRLYRAGMTCAQLAQRYSCHPETVARILRRNRVTRKRGRSGS